MMKYNMEYKQERFKLNTFCEFSHRDVEADFMEYEKTASLNTSRFLLLVLGLAFATFAVSDFIYYRHRSVFIVSVGLRMAVLILTVAVMSLLGKFKRYNNALLLVSATELAIFVVYLFNLFILQGQEATLQFMSIMLLILAVFLIPNVWKNCLFNGIVIFLGYIIYSAVFLDPDASPTLVQRTIYLGICLLACAISIYGRERSRRSQFAAEKLLEFMSIVDKLTSIYNRARFEYVLNMWIKNMRHNPFCLILFDIDDFKKVNDRFGHPAGDQALVATSEVVTASIRDDDFFARWGGEEFVILFGKTGIVRAVELAERLRCAVEANPCGEAGHITVSIGVVQYRRGETLGMLVKRADDKMYEAKQAGKNRVVSEEEPQELNSLPVTE